LIPLPHHRCLASRKAWSEASYPVSLNLHSWVILPTHGPLQQAIFFVVNAKHGRGLHAAHGRARRRMVALPPQCCRAEFRAYIAALQSNAVPGNEHACSEHACSEHACSEHGCFYLFIYLLIIFIYFERPRARIINNNILRTVQFATDRFEHRINYYILNENITIDRSSDSLLLLLRYFEIVWPNSHFPIRAAIGIPIFCLYHPYMFPICIIV